MGTCIQQVKQFVLELQGQLAATQQQNAEKDARYRELSTTLEKLKKFLVDGNAAEENS